MEYFIKMFSSLLRFEPIVSIVVRQHEYNSHILLFHNRVMQVFNFFYYYFDKKKNCWNNVNECIKLECVVQFNKKKAATICVVDFMLD